MLGGKNRAAKESSQYTSFAPQDGTGKVYGSEEIDKAAGQRVEVPSALKPHELSDFVDGLGLSKGKSRQVTDRVMALLNTRRDGEWLISGVVPKEYVTGPYPAS